MTILAAIMSWQFNFWNNYDLGNDNDDFGNDYELMKITILLMMLILVTMVTLGDDVVFGDNGYFW